MAADLSSSSLARVLARDIRPAIDLVDGLRACGVDREIDGVPQICVVGDQSSGKSSVLDALCGVPLPRGAGLTTRCAVELHLSDASSHSPARSTRPPSGSDTASDAASSSSSTSPALRPAPARWSATIATSVDPTPVTVSSPEQLGDAITARTEALTDERRAGGFSKERIIIRMSAPGLPDLSVIDLPGIIRTKTFNSFIPFTSDDRGAVAEVRDLLQSYMKQERTIMLVVVPCTQDVATNEALEWAARYDPAGTRTIGVMTKPDLVDPGAEEETVKVRMIRDSYNACNVHCAILTSPTLRVRDADTPSSFRFAPAVVGSHQPAQATDPRLRPAAQSQSARGDGKHIGGQGARKRGCLL
jgi:interferon-induced GTP-binding protein Mx